MNDDENLRDAEDLLREQRSRRAFLDLFAELLDRGADLRLEPRLADDLVGERSIAPEGRQDEDAMLLRRAHFRMGTGTPVMTPCRSLKR